MKDTKGRWLKCPYCTEKYYTGTDGDLCLHKALKEVRALRRTNEQLRKKLEKVPQTKKDQIKTTFPFNSDYEQELLAAGFRKVVEDGVTYYTKDVR